jgi:NAD(P)H dehydrogenase (quinone)
VELTGKTQARFTRSSPLAFDRRMQGGLSPMKVLICYYSTYGNVYKMANLVAEGVRQVAGAEPVLRTVPELIPRAVIEARADMKAGRDLQQDIPLVTADDFHEASAIAFGTPTRFGNVSSQLKN